MKGMELVKKQLDDERFDWSKVEEFLSRVAELTGLEALVAKRIERTLWHLEDGMIEARREVQVLQRRLADAVEDMAANEFCFGGRWVAQPAVQLEAAEARIGEGLQQMKEHYVLGREAGMWS